MNKLSENHDLDKIMNIFLNMFCFKVIDQLCLELGIENLNAQKNGQNKSVKSYTFLKIKGKRKPFQQRISWNLQIGEKNSL